MGMRVALEVIKGPARGRTFAFTEPRGFIIGRAKDADFRLPADDPYVSRRHVYLEVCPPRCRLQDLGSTNPPHVNDRPITEAELADGDIIELGYTQLLVGIDAEISDVRAKEEQQPGFLRKLFGRLVDVKAVPIAVPAAPTRALCSECGNDLSDRANSDGRMRELADVVIYRCDGCLPKRDEHGGKQIAGYEVVRAFAAGGMGVPYLVYDPRTARLLCLKQIKDIAKEQLRKRFKREATLLKRAAHPNIVRWVDSGIDSEGVPYLVMEYAPDGSLSDWFVRHPPSKRDDARTKQAVRLVCDALDGVEYIHSLETVHRDIKPDNILLRAASKKSDLVPKLADFGLAVCYGRAGGTRYTEKGKPLGTLMFMPPEQVTDAYSVKGTADLYAMGVTLYFMLTGQYSFNFPGPAALADFGTKNLKNVRDPKEVERAFLTLFHIMHPFHIILSTEPIPVRQREPSIPAVLADVIDKAVRKDAAQRYQSAAEFRRALEQAIA